MHAGFIGLGTMGLPMVRNLLRRGHTVTVYNRNRAKAEVLKKEEGVNMAESPAAVARQTEVLFTMVSDDAACLEVYLGEHGVVAGMEGGTLHTAVDSSTISPETSLRIAKAVEAQGASFLDAPVTGSLPQAVEGVLTFMVGGPEAAYTACLPLFEAMGKKAIHAGAQGAGAQLKLANNMLVAIQLAGLSESLALVAKAGVDPEKFLEVVAGGGASCRMADMKGPKILSGDFSPQFMLKLMLKDLKLAGHWSESLQTPAPTLSAVKALFQTGDREGFGDQDMAAIIRCYERWTGVEVRADV